MIDHPVLDGCSNRGIEVGLVAPGGIVAITEAYVTVAGTSALACVHIHDGAGSVVVREGQAVCASSSGAGGNAVGILVERQGGVVVAHTAVTESMRPVSFTSCTGCDVYPEVENLTARATIGGVFVNNCTRMRVAPKVTGVADAFPVGVELFGSGNIRVEVDRTRLDEGAISGGLSNLLTVNGISVTATGVFSGGVASGA